MSVILLDKKKFQRLLKEDGPVSTATSAVLGGERGNVSGDKAAADISKGKAAVKRAKSNLASLNILDLPDLDSINTVEQLAIEPFKISFVLQDFEDRQKEFNLPKPTEFSDLLAEVFKPEPLVLKLKNEAENQIIGYLEFDSEELTTRLPGTKKPIMALETKGKKRFYTVKGDDIFKKFLAGESQEQKGQEGETSEYAVDDEVNFTTDDGKEGTGKITKIEGDEYTIADGKGGEIVINKKNIKGKKEKKEEIKSEKEGNFYNGKDLKEVNVKLDEAKQKAKFFAIIKQYKDDPEFQKIFLDAIIDSTKSITINKKKLLITLKDLKSNGLLEADKPKKPGFEAVGKSMSGNQRKFLRAKLNLQNFMVDVFSLFAKLSKGGKQSETFKVIKKFYKQLYLIAVKGKSHISDEQTRKKLWRQLYGNFNEFLKALIKLPVMTKGKPKKEDEQEKEFKAKTTPKATMNTTTFMSYKLESIINQIAKNVTLLKEEGEEEVEEGNENEETPEETPEETKVDTNAFEAKIYLQSIELRSKATARKGEDKVNYMKTLEAAAGSDGGEKFKKSTLISDLPIGKPGTGIKINKVELKLTEENRLDNEQKKAFKEILTRLKESFYNGSALIRKSAKAKDNTMFIIEFKVEGKSVALVCKTNKPGIPLKNITDIIIADNAAGNEKLDKSTKATIQIKP